MPRLFLHIDQPKTATTTIQNHLAMNRKALLQDGWLYPNSVRQNIAHHPLVNFLDANPFYWIRTEDPVASHAALMKEIRLTGCDNVIMSTEALFSMRRPEKLVEWFKDFDIHLVVSLRRQDEWIESAYREQMKNGAVVVDTATYLQRSRVSLDYVQVLDRWRAVLGEGRIIILPFEKTDSTQPIENVFLDRIGYRSSAPLRSAVVKNESFNRDALAFIAGFAAKPRIGPKFHLFKTILAEYSRLHRDPPELRYVYDPATRAALVTKHATGNDRIAAVFLNLPGSPLFATSVPSPTDPWVPYPGLSATKAVEIAEFLAQGIYAGLTKES